MKLRKRFSSSRQISICLLALLMLFIATAGFRQDPGESDEAALAKATQNPLAAMYNLPNTWYIVSAPIMTAIWKASSGQRWIVPFDTSMGKVFKIGKLPVNLNAQLYYNAAKPDG